MQRAIWKGNISFGLVSIAVELFPAEKPYNLHFNLVDKKNHQRIHYARINEASGKEVPRSDIVKAYNLDGEMVELSEQEIKDLSVKNFKSIDIESFVDFSDLSPLYYVKPYYLIPNKQSEKPYVLLREVLNKANKIGIAKLVMHSRQHIAGIITCGNALVLEILRFKQELRDPKDYDFPANALSSYRIQPKEVEMAVQVVESMSAPWKPEIFHDDTHDVLLDWIKKKAKKPAKKEPKPRKAVQAKSKQVTDLMELLKKSIHKKSTQGLKKIRKQ